MTSHDVNQNGPTHTTVQSRARWLADRGASLVEYALLVSLIAVVCLAALRTFGIENDGSVNRSADKIVTAGQ